jgi:hypothetical protein
MNIDKALAQLADPEVSPKKKREIMDKLQEQTSPSKQNIGLSTALGVGLGGLGALAGGAAGRKLLQHELRKPDGAADIMAYMQLDKLAKAKGLPEGLRDNARKLADDVASYTSEDPRMRGAVLDAGTAAGGVIGGTTVGGAAAPFFGGLTQGNSEPNPQAQSALQQISEGRGDPEAYTDYYDRTKDNKGSTLAQFLAGAAVGIPAMYLGGPKFAKAMKKLIPDKNLAKSKFVSTPEGRNLFSEGVFDATVGGGLGAGAGSLAYNLTANPYEEPF